ncbi:DUF305 domain-containing protein [Mycobacterium sp. 21AC1]|uniref:DUF305 domain-containing protein n=1 Tax=[Mycobacterium] appelbergii TaxID=2939269 RepID=UPI00293943F2|nr:DUF305 domain-containing protein [Mycobacterium sp. 21AC1]MDV3124436.1 DUF305 domain-containing protein [Mycobacterium sp. 21AC1]
MWTRTILLGAGALVAVAAAAGCSNPADQQQASTSSAVATTVATTTSSVAPSVDAHNEADVMFAQHMIPHHQQAVEMSDMLLAKEGIDVRVTDLATQIKTAQGPEIEEMQGWLKDWGNPAMPPMPSDGTEHGGHGDMPAMQGMVSEEEMNALRDAQGVEAAKLFLTHMIAHHEGAITMAQDEIDDGQFPAALRLARAIIATQQQEIDTMHGILDTL